MSVTNESKLERHVRFCAGPSNMLLKSGDIGEQRTVDYLVANLDIEKVGDYRILVNYNMHVRNTGVVGELEIDLIVICRLGVFLIEVKNWRGMIEAYPDAWMQNTSQRHVNPLPRLSDKAKVIKSHLVGDRGIMNDCPNMRVEGVVVFSSPDVRYIQKNRFPAERVLKLDPKLLNSLSYKEVLFQNYELTILSDINIYNIFTELYGNYSEPKVHLIGHYRVIESLPAGDAFGTAYKVEHTYIGIERRMKVYKLEALVERQDLKLRQFRRSMHAITAVATHPNILQTHDFFPDDTRPDLFFEITEAIKGKRLDEYILDYSEGIPLLSQIAILKDVADALNHAHNFTDGRIQGVYHRRVCPKTIFVTEKGRAKLGDFDFAKIVSAEENTVSEMVQDTPSDMFVAPELLISPSAASPQSDIYSLGSVWYWMLITKKDDKISQVSANEPGKSSLIIEPTSVQALDVINDIKYLIEKMVHRNIIDRPKSMAVIIEDLRAIESKITQSA